jgi:hypothetical protein
MKKNISQIVVIIIAGFISGCVSTSKPIQLDGGVNKVNVVNALPKRLPQQSASIPNSQYVMIQSGGGSFLLGPILGSLNISAKTKALADKYNGKYVGIDPYNFAIKSMSEQNLLSKESNLKLKPFVFIQECDDKKFRLSLVYHITNKDWTGRYIYHFPTAYSKEEFSSPTKEGLNNYETELKLGSNKLIDLIKKDIEGKLTATGKKVDVGSLYLQGSKVGGMGVYTMPEELHFPNTDLMEEGDNHVVIRLNGNMTSTVIGGGLVFGTHYFERNQLHTYKKS